jgi:hypothetical protein
MMNQHDTAWLRKIIFLSLAVLFSNSAIENNVQTLANIELIAPPGKGYEYSIAN